MLEHCSGPFFQNCIGSHGTAIRTMEQIAHADDNAMVAQDATLCPFSGERRRYRKSTAHFEINSVKMYSICDAKSICSRSQSLWGVARAHPWSCTLEDDHDARVPCRSGSDLTATSSLVMSQTPHSQGERPAQTVLCRRSAQLNQQWRKSALSHAYRCRRENVVVGFPLSRLPAQPGFYQKAGPNKAKCSSNNDHDQSSPIGLGDDIGSGIHFGLHRSQLRTKDGVRSPLRGA